MADGDSPGFRDNHNAPIIYFDTAATFGVLNGAVQIELVGRTLIPTADGNARMEFVVTGRLRCSPTAAEQLRESINRSLDMLTRPGAGPESAPPPKPN